MFSKLSSSVIILILSVTILSHAEIPQMISYQGRVTFPSGEAIPDGMYDMEFLIWDADTGGSSVWSSGVQSVEVIASIFSVVLGEAPQPLIELPFDSDYWLEVIVEGDIQNPRKRLASVGYAYMAGGLVPGTEVVGEILTDEKAAIKGTNLATTGIGRGLFGESHSVQGRGVWGWARSTTGINVGVLGETASTEGWGVWGWSTATEGDTRGVFGQSDSETGVGVYGYAKTTTGANYGIHAHTRSSEGTAVYGRATATTGSTVGIHGTAPSPEGIGVMGIVGSTGGTTAGVLGEAASTAGHAVHGNATATTGYADGVYGTSASTDGKGVHGEATATTGFADGVYGHTASIDGRGVFGWASETTGAGIGVGARTDAPFGEAVAAEATSTSGGTWGVYGSNAAPDGGGVFGYSGSNSGRVSGVFGQSASSEGSGVYGMASASSDTTYGVWGESISPDGRGVYGLASSSTGSTMGVVGETCSMSSGLSYGVYGTTDSSGGLDFGVFGRRGEDPPAYPGGGAGVFGYSHIGAGVAGWTTTTYASCIGVWGEAISTITGATGVAGYTMSTEGYGVSGYANQSTGESYGGHFSTASTQGYGAYGETFATGVSASSPSGIFGKGGTGVRGQSSVENGNGIVGMATGTSAYGVYGESGSGYAGYFNGKAHVSGDFTVGGTKSFLIDHPLDPENRFLAHACIESDLPMNLYRGTVVLDSRGEARIGLPDWFEEINTDYSYNLTAVGAPAPDLHIAEEIEDNEFRIAGGTPGLKISWMVTAERNDRWVRKHPYVTERDKAVHERGYFIAPGLFGRTRDQAITRAREKLPTVRVQPLPQGAHLPRMGTIVKTR